MPDDSGVRVIAEALAISDGEEKEIQGKRVRITTLDISPAHQALIDPAELWRGFTDPRGA
jgi:hypothetical protein